MVDCRARGERDASEARFIAVIWQCPCRFVGLPSPWWRNLDIGAPICVGSEQLRSCCDSHFGLSLSIHATAIVLLAVWETIFQELIN